MRSGIYRLFCPISGKSYVGQSKNVDGRVEGHFRDLCKGHHKNNHLQNSFNLHGCEYFLAEVLELCDQKLLTKREQYWMDYYGSENLYNLAPVAGSTSGLKFNLSREARKKVSAASKISMIGNQNAKGKRSDETRTKMSNARKDKKHSDDVKMKMKESQRIRRARELEMKTER